MRRTMGRTNYTVDDVVQLLGVTPRTLHYYEEVGLIEPVARTVGRHRLYDENVIQRLRHILRLKEYLGFSLQEIRQVLDAENTLDELRVTYQGELTEEERNQVLSQYTELLQGLVNQIDSKLERLTEIRQGFVERLERARKVREERAAEQGASTQTQHTTDPASNDTPDAQDDSPDA